jgi:iron-sulfur cluster assembly protein
MSKRLLHRDTREGLHASPAKDSDTVVEEVIADPESVAVTPAAWQEIYRQLNKLDEAARAIRVGLRGGGCSGFTYTFEWDQKEPRAKDTVLREVLNGQDLQVYIDHRSLKLLKGTILDYHRSMMNQGFKFHNPNSTGSCGCGESTSF